MVRGQGSSVGVDHGHLGPINAGCSSNYFWQVNDVGDSDIHACHHFSQPHTRHHNPSALGRSVLHTQLHTQKESERPQRCTVALRERACANPVTHFLSIFFFHDSFFFLSSRLCVCVRVIACAPARARACVCVQVYLYLFVYVTAC